MKGRSPNFVKSPQFSDEKSTKKDVERAEIVTGDYVARVVDGCRVSYLGYGMR